MKRCAVKLPANLELADPRFNVSSDIDILIGTDLFWKSLCVGQIRAFGRHSTLQKTRFGWILAGRMSGMSNSAPSIHALSVSVKDMQLRDQVTRF